MAELIALIHTLSMTAKKLIGAAALSIMLLASSAAAQTSTTTSTSTDTVGTPNTGLGGSAAINLVVLGSSAAIALAGFALLARRKELR